MRTALAAIFAICASCATSSANLPGGAGLSELSMGMSGDFEAAVEEGATIVRIGSALFEGIELIRRDCSSRGRTAPSRTKCNSSPGTATGVAETTSPHSNAGLGLCCVAVWIGMARPSSSSTVWAAWAASRGWLHWRLKWSCTICRGRRSELLINVCRNSAAAWAFDKCPSSPSTRAINIGCRPLDRCIATS